MTECIYLLGAEQVERAGHAVQTSAETMRQAAAVMSEELYHFREFLTTWLADFERALSEDRARRSGGQQA